MNFAYTPDRLTAIERCLSVERLSFYMDECEGDLETAIRMYQLNTKLASSFYTALQGIEVAVRNEMNDQLKAKFGENWHDLTQIRLLPRHQDDVRQAVAEAAGTTHRGAQISPTNGQVVAALRFGFWVGILGPKNENEVWRKALYKGFAYRGKGNERKVVHGALDQIRQLRNLVAHHRRILHRDLVSDHANILEVASWVCPHVHAWIEVHSDFDPSNLPVPQAALPNLGLQDIDPLPPVTLIKDEVPTRDGRARLSLKSA